MIFTLNLLFANRKMPSFKSLMSHYQSSSINNELLSFRDPASF